MTTSQTIQIPAGSRFIDCASFLSPSVIRAALADGITGFMKYTRYDNTARGKYWTEPEWKAVLELGGYVMSNWEIQADRATISSDPYATGLSDGKRNRGWLSTIGYPNDVSAPVSVDQNTFDANFYKVHPFCHGHWDGDGDDCENIGYLDTDGGRALADLDPRIWIPGAFGWSPELWSLNVALKAQGMSERDRYVRVAAKAAENPQAVAIQFPSEAAYGIRVDKNLVLKPFNVWCAEYTVTPAPPRPPEVIIPPVVIPPTPPAYDPKKDTMATARLVIPGHNAQFLGTGTLLADGTVHCLLITWTGPGPDPDNGIEGALFSDHYSAPDTVRQETSMETLRRDLILVGDPAEIQDSTMPGGWQDNHFARVVK